MISTLKRWFLQREAAAAHPAEPDWDQIADYYDLCSAAAACEWLTPDAFLAGPFRRYLELCADPDTHVRVRARAMEFGRSSVVDFARHLEAAGTMAASEFERRAADMAAAWFADKPNGDYMLEVLDGTGTHNFRAPKPPATR